MNKWKKNQNKPREWVNSFEVRLRFASRTKALNGDHHRLERKKWDGLECEKPFPHRITTRSPDERHEAEQTLRNDEFLRSAQQVAEIFQYFQMSDFCRCAACHPLVRAPFTLSIFYSTLSCLTRWLFCVHSARRKRRQRSGGEKWFNSRHSLALPRLWACSHLADSKFLSTEKMCRRNEDDFLVSPSLLLCFHSVHNGWLKIAAYNSNASKISPTHIAQACWLNRKNSKISLRFTFSLSSFGARRLRSLVYIFKNLKNIFTLSLG